jgi:hypothetical protein
VAAPVSGIDGDLSDWPNGFERYPISLVEAGDPLAEEGDFEGRLRFSFASATLLS